MDTAVGIEQVVRNYSSTVYGVALTHTANRVDADDVFQEVFAAYWRTQPSLTSEEHRKAWLIRTTLNFCLKITQSSWAKRTVLVEGSVAGARESSLAAGYSEVPLDDAWHRLSSSEEARLPSADFPFQTEEQTRLYKALRTLTAPYRIIVQLFYFEDLPIAQIAQILGEAPGTVKTRLSRARAQLREKLKEGNRDD